MSALNLLYPPVCTHCRQLLEEQNVFCADCQQQFRLLDGIGHCSKCFSSIPSPQGICKSCRKIRSPFSRLSACFDAYGPAMSLLRDFTSQKHYHLAKDIASYIVVQLSRLHYPTFQTITMVPNAFANPQYAVGKEIANMLEVPFVPILRKKTSPKKIFRRKKKWTIMNQVVLLIDLEMHTRQTMRSAAWALDQEITESIYGITFCATLH